MGCAWEGTQADLGTHRCMFSDVTAFLQFRRSLVVLLDMFGFEELIPTIDPSDNAGRPATPPRVAKRTPYNSPVSVESSDCEPTDMPDLDLLYLY